MSELIERCKERLEKNITVWCDWKDDIIELINKPMPAEPECDTELKCEWMKALRKLKAAEAKLAELKRTTVTTEYHDSIVHSWLVEKVALEALIAPARAAVDYLWEVKEWKLAANLNAALEKVK